MAGPQAENPIFSAPLPKPESLGLPKDIKILWRTDKKVLFCEIPMNRFKSDDVPVDASLLHSLERKMDRETQHRQWNGQLGPGIIAQVIDPVVGVNGDLFLCEGFHRNAVQQKKKAENFFSELRLGYNFDQMLGLRIVSATGHRSVEMPRIVDWVTQSWNITPWSKVHKISIFQGFSLVTVPNMTGKEIMKKTGLTREDIESIKAWVIEHCDDWKKKPQLIMAHLDLARKVSPELIRMQRIGEKGISLTPAQTRAIGNVLPGEHNWSLQRIAAQIAIEQKLNEATTRKVAVSLSQIKDEEQIYQIKNTDWASQQVITGRRINVANSGEMTSNIINRLWDLEVENADLLIQLAISRKNFVPGQTGGVKDAVTDNQISSVKVGVKQITHATIADFQPLPERGKIDTERLNSHAEDAITQAQEGNGALLYRYFEDVLERPLRGLLRRKFGVEDYDFDDIKQNTFEKALKSIGNFTFKYEEIPSHAQLSAWLNRIAINTTIDTHRVEKKRSKDINIDEPTGKEGSEESRVDHSDFDQSAVTPEEQVVVNWESEKIKAAILKLPEADQRRVIIMKYVLGHTTKDIAYVLDKREGAVRAQLMRSSNKLQDVLKDIKSEI